jgi:thiol-disulfide isomerase/thioredoxin
MDRLPAVIPLLLCGAAACKSAPETSPRSRVDAVKAGAERPVSLEAFCDAQPGAVQLALPQLAGTPPAAATRGQRGWTWVNLWATWCAPCVEEIPLLLRFREQLRAEGIELNLRLLSVDDSDEAVQRFRRSHPEFPVGERMAASDAAGPWLTAIGLDSAASIPVHVFADPGGRIRCARAGAIAAGDYRTIRHLVAAPGAGRPGAPAPGAPGAGGAP